MSSLLFHAWSDQFPHESLLFGDACARIDDVQIELIHDSIILVEYFALKQTEAFGRVRAPAQVHARFVELELHAARHEPVERDLDGHSEIERQIRPDGEAVQLAHPLPIDPPRRVPRKGRVGVAVREHDHAGLERRNDLIEQPVGEVGGVQQAERHRGERVFLLARSWSPPSRGRTSSIR